MAQISPSRARLKRARRLVTVADRNLYERSKRDLARKTWKYVQNYADAKSEVVQGITRSAWSVGSHKHLVRQCAETVAGSFCMTKSRGAPGTPYSYGP